MTFASKLLKQLGLAMAIAAALVLLIELLAWNAERITDRITAQKQTLSFRTHAMQVLPFLVAQAKKAQPFMQQLQQMLPAQEELTSLDQDLVKLAKKHALDATVTIKDGTTLTIEAHGTYANFIRFLKDIEKNRFYINAETMNFTKRGDAYAITTDVTVTHR